MQRAASLPKGFLVGFRRCKVCFYDIHLCCVPGYALRLIEEGPLVCGPCSLSTWVKWPKSWRSDHSGSRGNVTLMAPGAEEGCVRGRCVSIYKFPSLKPDIGVKFGAQQACSPA